MDLLVPLLQGLLLAAGHMLLVRFMLRQLMAREALFLVAGVGMACATLAMGLWIIEHGADGWTGPAVCLVTYLVSFSVGLALSCKHRQRQLA